MSLVAATRHRERL